MKTTILVYRKRIQQIEIAAADKVEVFKNPFLLQDEKKRQQLNDILMRKISPLEKEAMKEGKKYGTFIHDLVIEIRKNPKKKGQVKKAAGKSGKKLSLDRNKEREFLIKEVIHIQDNMVFQINQQTKRMENQGMSKKEIFKYLRGTWMLIEWQAVKNKLRKEIADYINAVSNYSYYTALLGLENDGS